MKFMTSELVSVFRQKRSQRNLGLLVKFFVVLVAMVAIYSVLFHFIMMYEDRQFTWITGFYWTLTVMSTLGFGDITFNSDLGRFFSMVVLMSGIVFLLIMLPFTFIEFFYAPWLEAQTAMRTPRKLATETKGHVVLANYDPVSAALIRKLEQFHYDYVLIAPDPTEALALVDKGVRVVVGEIDNPDTYRRVHADKAALVTTTHTDLINTNVAFTVREIASDVPIVATCNKTNSIDILSRAGATGVLQLGDMMGKAMARCTVGGDAVSHEIGNVDEVLIAEANASNTPLVGMTIREARLTEIGVSVVGIWDRGEFTYARPDSVIGEHAILVLIGSAEHFQSYDERYIIYNYSGKPVVILGGGRVGRAASRALAARGIRSCIVEQLPERIPEDLESVIGDAADLEVLKKAGLNDAPAVLITTHDDSLNIYLTIYCRSLYPDIQIISRSTLERNTATLHRAGADFVLSYSSMGATNMFNLIERSKVVTITEGLEIFRTNVNEHLAGKAIAKSGVRETTGCTIVAVRIDEKFEINPPADTVLKNGQEMIIVGDVESEEQFLERFG